MNRDTKDILKIGFGIFCILAGAGLVFTGIGIIGSFFFWWLAYQILTK